MNVCVGMVTFGQIKYTKMALKYLYLNTEMKFDFFGVVGKPKDRETVALFNEYFGKYMTFNFTEHTENKGFPYSLNDIYEYAFVLNNYDYCIILGNDVLVYPHAIDYLVETAEEFNLDYVSSQEVTVDMIKESVPETKSLFGYGKKFLRDDFPEYLKYKFSITNRKYNLSKFRIIGDTHNLSLFSKSWFDSVGYVDVNFYPAYFEDNDYARRGQLLNMRMYQIQRAKYFHFWSRTIKEDRNKEKENDFYFPKNRKYYIDKWGGEPGKELFTLPFNGKPYVLGGVFVPSVTLKIATRRNENALVTYWRSLYRNP